MKQTVIILLVFLFLGACNTGSLKDQKKTADNGKTSGLEISDQAHKQKDSLPETHRKPDAPDAGGMVHLDKQIPNLPFDAYEDYISQGLEHYRVKEYTEAINKLNLAVLSNPDHPKAYYYRGQIYVDLNDFKTAKDDFLKVTSMVKDDHRAWNFLGVTQTHGGDNQMAVESYNKAIDLDPNNSMYHFNRGSSLGQLGKLQEALVDFDKAIELGLNTSGIYNNRANTRYMLRDYRGAIADFTRSMEIDPKSMAPFANRGIAYLYTGDTILACADWQRALQMGHPLVREYLELYCK